MENYEKYICNWSKRPFFAIYTPPLHHVTILYLKKGQSPPQGNEPFFDPFSGTKRHVTVWTNQRVRTDTLTPPFRPYSFISIGWEADTKSHDFQITKVNFSHNENILHIRNM